MPELPDLTIYIEHLDRRITGTRLDAIRIASPFVLRSVEPSVDDVVGREVVGVSRLAKQLVFELSDAYFLVVHLMISGRFQWRDRGAKIPKRLGLAAFDFASGTVLFTEASKKKRASLRLVEGRDALEALNPGGVEVMGLDVDAFAAQLLRSNHTLKRALTDQHVFAGIGNAYSDEILLAAKLSPFKRPVNLSDAEMERLHGAVQDTLGRWTSLLREKAGDKFPSKVTAFHPEMAVHGKYKEPCPVCAAPVQRILYAENESNYCARCQTGGRMLADRSLSKLLKDNWPKRIEELEG